MAVQRRDKHKGNKLARGASSVRGIAVTAKPGGKKLQAGQKFSQSKANKPVLSPCKLSTEPVACY